MRKASAPHPDTRELILDAAGSIFAEHGFHAATVRQITRKAGVNLAAVNYHFRDKGELYASALQRAHQAGSRTAEADLAGPAEERLRIFIRMFLGYLLDPGRPEWHGSLIAREMAKPTPALDRLAAETIAPVKRRISGIVREILGSDAPDTRISLSCLSIIAQCLHYAQCRALISRLFPEGSRALRDVETLSNHIFIFSLAGLQAMKASPPYKPQPRRSRAAHAL